MSCPGTRAPVQDTQQQRAGKLSGMARMAKAAAAKAAQLTQQDAE